MQEKGLGTPATRSSIIEGLIAEKYMLREGRELIPTAKAFQLMTLLRGLGAEELSKAELTGEWEYKLALMEQGKLKREVFMAEIAAMTERLVKKAKEYDRDTIPGDYATLAAPCPNCGGIVKENYRRYTCTGKSAAAEGCGFSFGKTPAGRTFELAEVEQFLTDKKIGPLDGFRSKAGWPFTAEMVIKFDEETKNFKLEFDFGDDKAGEESGEIIDFSAKTALGVCPKCGGSVFEHGTMCVIAPFQPCRNPRRVVISKADKSFCSNPLRVSKWKNCWPPGKPICSISLSACARGGLSRPCWPGTRRPGKSASNLPQVNSRLEKRLLVKLRLKPPLKAQ